MTNETKKTIAFCWPPKKCSECKVTDKCAYYEYMQNLHGKN
ncbi:hypothetical protein LCGC14_0316450 [marine sediment metagenome]|uniref:Uncharacterized protein n=1 Tax=marine sediment metagenome TaxID=412755 RepID=A0A0F9WSF6_9ZZZZ